MMTDRDLDDALGKLGAPEGVAPRVDAAQVLARAASVRAAAAGTGGSAAGAAIAWGSATAGVLLAAVAVVALRPLSVDLAAPGAAAPGTFGASVAAPEVAFRPPVAASTATAAPELAFRPPAAASTAPVAPAPAPRTITPGPDREARARRLAGRRAARVVDAPRAAPVAADPVMRVTVATPPAMQPDAPAEAAPVAAWGRQEEVAEVRGAGPTPFDLRLWAQGGGSPASGAGAGAAMGAGFAWSPALGGGGAPEVWLDLGVGASEGVAPRPGAAAAWTGLARLGAGATFGSGSWRLGAAWTATAHLPLDAAPPEVEPSHVGLSSGPALALVVGRPDAVTGRLGVAADLVSEGPHEPLRVVPSALLSVSVPLGEKI